MKDKEYYKAEEIAELFNVNIMTIYRYIKAKRLTAYKIGGEFRIHQADLDAFLKSVKTN